MSNRNEPQSQALHVITLISSTMPLALPVLSAPELAGLAAFRSRRIEDGRERFRVHIGYFATTAEAENLLPFVRDTYPWAFVALAPLADLSSLDDTAIARFSIVHPGHPAPDDPAAGAPDATVQQLSPPPPRPSPGASPPVLSMADAVVPASARGSRPAAARVESTPVATTSNAAAPVAAAPVAAAPVAAAPPNKIMQRYAVQLIWSKDPIDLAKIPSLAIFGGYLLYAVETEPAGRRMFGVRLGFYDDALSARLVALYVRTTFRGVVVVPVSEREAKVASAATIRLTGARSVRGGATSRAAWPRAAVSVAFTAATVDAAGDPASALF